MLVSRLPEKASISEKFENCRMWSILMSRTVVVLKFFLSQTSMLLQNAEKGRNTGNRFLCAGELGMYYSNVYGKISFTHLNILASVYRRYRIDVQ